MKTLILLRHAKSSWKDPGIKDRDRPLNKRGKRDAPFMGRRLASRALPVDLILTSPAKRARQTAGYVARELGYPEEEILLVERLYAADGDDLLAVLNDVEDQVQCLMLVGHNPEFTLLASQLAGLEIATIPTSGMIGLTFPVDSWHHLGTGISTQLFVDFPKNSEHGTGIETYEP